MMLRTILYLMLFVGSAVSGGEHHHQRNRSTRIRKTAATWSSLSIPRRWRLFSHPTMSQKPNLAASAHIATTIPRDGGAGVGRLLLDLTRFSSHPTTTLTTTSQKQKLDAASALDYIATTTNIPRGGAKGPRLLLDPTTRLFSHSSSSSSSRQPKPMLKLVSALSIATSLPRGGAKGPLLDPTQVAKLYCVLQLVHACLWYLSPTKILTTYNFPKSAFNVFMIENMGIALFNYSLQITAIVIYGQTLHKAVAIGAVPYFISNLKLVLNRQTTKQLGISVTSSIITVILSGLALYGGLHGTNWMSSYVIYLTWFTIMNGIIGCLSPQLLSKAWGDHVYGEDHISLIRGNSLLALSYGIFQQSCLLMKLDDDKTSVNKAIGYSTIPHLSHIQSMLFITKEVDKYRMEKRYMYTLMVIYMIVILGTTLAF